MAIARERIAKELEQKTGFLNLGRLGLTHFPKELAILEHLKSLNLGSIWHDLDGKRQSDHNGRSNRLNDANWGFLGQLPNLKSLFVASCGLKNIEQIRNSQGLVQLIIGDNPISDISALSSLNALQQFDCSETEVCDFTPLSGLLDLETLECYAAPVSDIRPLSELHYLHEFSCMKSLVSDLAPLSRLRSLRLLQCYGTPVDDLSPLENLQSLQSIDCSGTLVSDLRHLSRLASLELLFFHGSRVEDLRPLSQLKSLKSINCSNTPVRSLSPLSRLRELHTLYCQNTEIADISALAEIQSLQKLDCSGTKVRDLSPISQIQSLKSIDCSGTQIADLAPASNLQSLQIFRFSNTEVNNLEPLSRLRSLRLVEFAGTQVRNLAPLSGMQSLKSIDCTDTSISDLSPLSDLQSLESLDCTRTDIADLAPLTRLRSLKSLNFSNTKVSSLVSLAGMHMIESVVCSGTIVSDLSPLSELKNLRSLTISGTKVTDLRPLACTNTIQWLSCSDTQISDLSPLKDLSLLWSLTFNGALVDNLQPIVGIKALKKVWASGNPLKNLPEELVFKPELVDLCLFDVPISGLPPEVLSGHTYDSCLFRLRSHYLDLRNGSVPMPDIKIMVLGNGRIGKTQICRRLRGEPYEPDADSTHGITVTSTPFGCGSPGGTESLLHLWDFGGQDIYHGTHALFMRSRAVFFAVWTPSSEDRTEHEHRGIRFRNHRLDYWLDLVRQLGGANSPVLLIQTQCDAVEDELRHPPVPDALLDQFGFCKVLHYSARENRGRASLDEALGQAIQWTRKQQGEVRIGTGRLKVRRRLEKLRDEDAELPPTERKNRVLNKDFVVRICDEEGGVSNPDHLIAYLHECGVIFHRPGVFEDAIILDQEWALEAIYTLFNREKCWRQLRQLNGRFTRSLLATLVWQDYEEGEQALFIEMMKSAGICFVHREGDPRSRTETEYIAPDLLPEVSGVEEELAAFWQDEPAEEQILDFPFEHPGLVRNVIARIGKSAGMNAVYWKGGVCGYERKTHSAIRIDTLPPGAGKPYQLRLQIRTQRGRAKELLEQAIEWIKVEAHQSGCQTFDSVKALTKPRKKPERFPNEKLEEIDGASLGKEPDFGPPPRKAGKAYCVSYAWNKKSEEFVDQLCADAAARGIEVIRDKTHLGLGERISKFMTRLGAGDRVFVILSENYLQSPFCMFELFEVWNQSKRDDEGFLKRVRIYRLPDAKIGTLKERVEIGAYWKKEYIDVEAMIKEHGPDIIGGNDFKRYKLMKDFALHVGDILGLVMDTLQPQTLEEFELFSFDLPG